MTPYSGETDPAARALQDSFLQSLGRMIFLKVVPQDAERCLIEAPIDDTVAFRGDAVDAPVLGCGKCHAPLVVAVDRRCLTNMVIECGRCGNFNRTRE
ncbi:MAG TPA: hypothetical protein VMG40_14580 [Bryobacteraceae bacterium]|nr:hypothetical protein [Bryobacteraceae bacterium]